MNSTILIPHKSSKYNDDSLDLNIQMLKDNSVFEHELIILRELEDPYTLWNRYAEKAQYDILVMSNSDVLMGPGWDEYLLPAVDERSIVTGYLVECGVIGVADKNIHLDFGRHPGVFDRDGFESYCKKHWEDVPPVIDERAWYMPCAMHKEFFFAMGRFPCEEIFPYPNDILFWEHCITNGAILRRARSFAYHFQNLSNADHDCKRGVDSAKVDVAATAHVRPPPASYSSESIKIEARRDRGPRVRKK